jgi:hypothetical protein
LKVFWQNIRPSALTSSNPLLGPKILCSHTENCSKVDSQKIRRVKMPAKWKKLAPPGATDLKPADFPLGSLPSRAAARALVKAKEKDKNIVKILNFDWEPDHPPELMNSFEDSEGQLWEVWKVPEGLLALPKGG